jgi:hypothetical protein
MTSIIAQTLDAYAQSASKIFTHDRMNTLGASEVGQCARKMFWLKNEQDSQLRVPRDPEYVDTWGARARGSVFEDAFWVPAMKKRFGKRLKFAGKQQKTFVKDFLSATPDGIIINLTPEERVAIGTEADCAMVECKTADPRTNLSQAKQSNVFQTQVQMGLVREMTKYKPSHSVLSYTDASFWNEVKEFTIAFDQKLYETAQARATMIMTAISVNETKPEGWIAGGYECRYCPFTIPCGVERRNLPFAENEEEIDPQLYAVMSCVRHPYPIGALDRTPRGTISKQAGLSVIAHTERASLRKKGCRSESPPR